MVYHPANNNHDESSSSSFLDNLLSAITFEKHLAIMMVPHHHRGGVPSPGTITTGQHPKDGRDEIDHHHHNIVQVERGSIIVSSDDHDSLIDESKIETSWEIYSKHFHHRVVAERKRQSPADKEEIGSLLTPNKSKETDNAPPNNRDWGVDYTRI